MSPKMNHSMNQSEHTGGVMHVASSSDTVCESPMQRAMTVFLGAGQLLKPAPIDFPGFLTSCEMNYAKFMKVFPSVESDDTRCIEMHFQNQDTAKFQLQVEERTAHTCKIALRLFDQNAYLQEAEMQIRVYHDMRVVEVLSVQSVDVRKSSIRISDTGILQPSERLQASVLLSDWLGHCLHFGTVPFALEV